MMLRDKTSTQNFEKLYLTRENGSFLKSSRHLLPVTAESASVKPHYLHLPERQALQFSDSKIESQFPPFPLNVGEGDEFWSVCFFIKACLTAEPFPQRMRY